MLTSYCPRRSRCGIAPIETPHGVACCNKTVTLGRYSLVRRNAAAAACDDMLSTGDLPDTDSSGAPLAGRAQTGRAPHDGRLSGHCDGRHFFQSTGLRRARMAALAALGRDRAAPSLTQAHRESGAARPAAAPRPAAARAHVHQSHHLSDAAAWPQHPYRPGVLRARQSVATDRPAARARPGPAV